MYFKLLKKLFPSFYQMVRGEAWQDIERLLNIRIEKEYPEQALELSNNLLAYLSFNNDTCDMFCCKDKSKYCPDNEQCCMSTKRK